MSARVWVPLSWPVRKPWGTVEAVLKEAMRRDLEFTEGAIEERPDGATRVVWAEVDRLALMLSMPGAKAVIA